MYGETLETLQGCNVLTVGRAPDFIDAGGGMSLLFEPETLHFDINLAAADGAHLTISAGTLPLARRAVHLQEIAKS